MCGRLGYPPCLFQALQLVLPLSKTRKLPRAVAFFDPNIFKNLFTNIKNLFYFLPGECNFA
ncbi:hypothetical protein HMPREF1632_01465 [Mageeibacillus indolicus 0009-5]|nr:hypothetical protein HMPREF1632_01465 [Mageeibacillus indolicus 0009-5]